MGRRSSLRPLLVTTGRPVGRGLKVVLYELETDIDAVCASVDDPEEILQIMVRSARTMLERIRDIGGRPDIGQRMARLAKLAEKFSHDRDDKTEAVEA